MAEGRGGRSSGREERGAAEGGQGEEQRGQPGNSFSVPASGNGFSKYSGKNNISRTQPPAIRHPGSWRAFGDIRVTKLLFSERNIKKISFLYVRQEKLFPGCPRCSSPCPPSAAPLSSLPLLRPPRPSAIHSASLSPPCILRHEIPIGQKTGQNKTNCYCIFNKDSLL